MSSRLVERRLRDYSPLSWGNYFDEAQDIDCRGFTDEQKVCGDDETFRVYLKNFKPPFAPARDIGSKLAEPIDISEDESRRYEQIPTIVTLHGGGYSALTWAQFSQHVNLECQCRILSLDLRSHGDTKTVDDQRMDIDTLVEDVARVVHIAHEQCGFIRTPKIVLIGHSMGGAIAVKLSYRCMDLMPTLSGFVIIDVVEGTAKDALPLMMSVIQTRPTRFTSLSHAIEWCVKSGMAKDVDAARVSMPSNLVNIETGHLGIHDICGQDDGLKALESMSNITRHKFPVQLDGSYKSHRTGTMPYKVYHPYPRVAALKSDSFELSAESCSNKNSRLEQITEIMKQITAATDKKDDKTHLEDAKINETGYCWRTDLARTQPFWNGWFDGLSDQLLNAPVRGKFLLLAGIDRLDKTLTIGQMQGKFMMKVLPRCGHAVHEDLPHRVAVEVGQFLVRNKFANAHASR